MTNMEDNEELDPAFNAEEIPSPSDLWNYMEYYWHNNREFPESTEGLLKRKADLVDGKVPSSQLPSYVDDVQEFDSFENLPNPGEKGKIYLTADNSSIFRWTGSEYIQLNSEIDGELIIYSVPNSSGTILTYNSNTKEVSTRTNTEIISDLSLMNTNSEQITTARKIFGGATGNRFDESAIETRGSNSSGIYPSIGFHQPGLYAGTISMRNANQFYFRDTTDSDFVYLNSKGYIKSGSDGDHLLLGDGSDILKHSFVQVGGTSSSNRIYLGWDGYRIRTQVDNTFTGYIWTDENSKPLNNGMNNTLKTITSANYNDIVDGGGMIWLGDVYGIPTSDTGMESIYGTIFNLNGLDAHDKTQLIFNGQNGHIQYRKSFFANTPWTALRTLHDSDNLPNPMASRGFWYNAFLAKNDYINSVTQYAGDPATTGFKSYYGTSLHLRGTDNWWFNRLDFSTNGDRIDLWQGINVTDMSHRGSIPIIPEGITNWTNENLPDFRIYGLGTFSPQYLIDINTPKPTGFYNYYAGQTTGDSPFGYATILHQAYMNSNEFTQIAIQKGGIGMAFRTENTDWKKVYHEDNFNPDTKVNKSGDTMTGTLSLNQGLILNDTTVPQDWSIYQTTSGINFYVTGGSTQGDVIKFDQDGTITTLLNGSSNLWYTAYQNGLVNRGAIFQSNVDANNLGNQQSAIVSIETGNGTGNTNFPNNSTYGTFMKMSAKSFTSEFFHITGGDLYHRNWYLADNPSTTPFRKIYDNINLPNPATQDQLNTKVNNIENVLGIGFTGGDADLAPYFYHPTAGHRFLGTQTWVNQNFIPKTHPANNITQNYLDGWFSYWGYGDRRVISPSSVQPTKLQFGFTTWNQNNNSPFADYLHFGGYTDSSGQNQNLIVFNKQTFGLRQYQGTWQSPTSYQSFVDYWNTGHFTLDDISNWGQAYLWGNHASAGYTTQTWVESQDYATNNVVNEKVQQITGEFFDPAPSVYIENKFTTIIRTEEYAGVPIDIDGELIPTGNISIINLSEKPLEILRSGKYINTVPERTTAEYYITKEQRIIRKGSYRTAELLV